jgi:hypothetical protein
VVLLSQNNIEIYSYQQFYSINRNWFAAKIFQTNKNSLRSKNRKTFKSIPQTLEKYIKNVNLPRWRLKFVMAHAVSGWNDKSWLMNWLEKWKRNPRDLQSFK